MSAELDQTGRANPEVGPITLTQKVGCLARIVAGTAFEVAKVPFTLNSDLLPDLTPSEGVDATTPRTPVVLPVSPSRGLSGRLHADSRRWPGSF